jgi:uncharacterized protein YcfJ
MNKLKIVLTAIAMITIASPSVADERNTLGAVAGGVLGNMIGHGSGRTAATVIGAIVGYNAGPKVLNRPAPRYEDNVEYVEVPYSRYRRMNQADIYDICRDRNPYPYNSRMFWEYNSGCVQRLSDRAAAMERRAFDNGYYNN